jgi:hypothetical protein
MTLGGGHHEPDHLDPTAGQVEAHASRTAVDTGMGSTTPQPAALRTASLATHQEHAASRRSAVGSLVSVSRSSAL